MLPKRMWSYKVCCDILKKVFGVKKVCDVVKKRCGIVKKGRSDM